MRLIAFDLDDTIYKEREFVASGYRAIARMLAERYGLDCAEMVHVMSTAPLNPFDSLKEYLTNRAVQRGIVIKENVSWMVNAYRNHLPDIIMSPETYDTLIWLKHCGNRLAMITDGRVTTQSNKIKSLGIDRIIEWRNISISEAVGAEKYDILPFERIMSLNDDISEFVYVGDNPMKDFVWPNRLGWITVQLLDNGLNVHSQKIFLPDDDYKPQITISDLSQLKDMFK